LPHILACTCCFTSALHQIYDNEFLSEIIKKIYKKFTENFEKSLENPEDPETFQILKNISLVLSYFYIFDSISLDFINEYLSFLIEKMNGEIIELLLIIIQNIGTKVRKDNPKILKDLIDFIKDSFEKYKVSKGIPSLQRGDFLLMMLNDIKLNKNIKNNPFESLSFLMGWVKKNVVGRMKLVPKIFCIGFKSLKNADFEKNKWWIQRESINLHDLGKVIYIYIYNIYKFVKGH